MPEVLGKLLRPVGDGRKFCCEVGEEGIDRLKVILSDFLHKLQCQVIRAVERLFHVDETLFL